MNAAPARPGMTPGRVERLGDWLNPILVKEVRQAVRGREFNYSFAISLFIGLLIALIGSANAEPGGTTGEEVFTWLMVCLGIVGLAVVPIGAFFALNSERVEKTFDLVTLTALSHRSIVVGKLLAQTVKLLTFFAALSPFMAMSFLLGGVDLPSILSTLVTLFLASLWACAACLCLSTVGKSRGTAFVLLGVFGLPFMGMVPSLVSLLFYSFGGGHSGSFITMWAGASWSSIGSALALWLVSLVNLILLTVNRIAPPTDNRTSALRAGFLVQFLLILGLVVAAHWKDPTDLGDVLALTAGLHLAVVALFTVTEDLTLPRRVRQALPKNPIVYWLTAIFWPGGGHGALYVLVQSAVILAATGALARPASNDLTEIAALCCYVWFFSGPPALAGRLLAPRRIRPMLLRLAILFFLLAGTVTPLLMVPNLEVGKVPLYSARYLLNPFVTLHDWHDVLAHGWPGVICGFGIVGLLSYLGLVILGERARRQGDMLAPAAAAAPGVTPPIVAPVADPPRPGLETTRDNDIH